MLRRLTAMAIGVLLFTPGCNKKDDASSAPAASAQAPAASAGGGADHRDCEHDHEHEGDGGRRGADHPSQEAMAPASRVDAIGAVGSKPIGTQASITRRETRTEGRTREWIDWSVLSSVLLTSRIKERREPSKRTDRGVVMRSSGVLACVSCVAVAVACSSSIGGGTPQDSGAVDTSFESDSGGGETSAEDAGSDSSAPETGAEGGAGDATMCNTVLPEFVTTDLTLTKACSPYNAPLPVLVGDATNHPVLTIEPGVTVTFASNAYLSIGMGQTAAAPGGLQAAGTPTSPIVLTSGAANPTAGAWGGVYFNPTADATSTLSNAVVKYAGQQFAPLLNTPVDLGSIYVDAGTQSPLSQFHPAAHPLSNLTVSNNGGSGIVFFGPYAGFAASSGELTIPDWASGGYPIVIDPNSADTLPTTLTTGSSGHQGGIGIVAEEAEHPAAAARNSSSTTRRGLRSPSRTSSMSPSIRTPQRGRVRPLCRWDRQRHEHAHDRRTQHGRVPEARGRRSVRHLPESEPFGRADHRERIDVDSHRVHVGAGGPRPRGLGGDHHQLRCDGFRHDELCVLHVLVCGGDHVRGAAGGERAVFQRQPSLPSRRGRIGDRRATGHSLQLHELRRLRHRRARPAQRGHYLWRGHDRDQRKHLHARFREYGRRVHADELLRRYRPKPPGRSPTAKRPYLIVRGSPADALSQAHERRSDDQSGQNEDDSARRQESTCATDVCLLFAVVLTASCSRTTGSAPSDDHEAKAEPQVERPGLGEVMVQVGRRFEVAGRAASANRFELAAFEANELGELFENDVPRASLPKEGPTSQIPAMAKAFLESMPPELNRAAASGDRAAFALAFQHAAAMCNACHESAAKGFIQVPSVPGRSVPTLDPLPPPSGSSQ